MSTVGAVQPSKDPPVGVEGKDPPGKDTFQSKWKYCTLTELHGKQNKKKVTPELDPETEILMGGGFPDVVRTQQAWGLWSTGKWVVGPVLAVGGVGWFTGLTAGLPSVRSLHEGTESWMSHARNVGLRVPAIVAAGVALAGVALTEVIFAMEGLDALAAPDKLSGVTINEKGAARAVWSRTGGAAVGLGAGVVVAGGLVATGVVATGVTVMSVAAAGTVVWGAWRRKERDADLVDRDLLRVVGVSGRGRRAVESSYHYVAHLVKDGAEAEDEVVGLAEVRDEVWQKLAPLINQATHSEVDFAVTDINVARAWAEKYAKRFYGAMAELYTKISEQRSIFVVGAEIWKERMRFQVEEELCVICLLPFALAALVTLDVLVAGCSGVLKYAPIGGQFKIARDTIAGKNDNFDTNFKEMFALLVDRWHAANKAAMDIMEEIRAGVDHTNLKSNKGKKSEFLTLRRVYYYLREVQDKTHGELKTVLAEREEGDQDEKKLLEEMLGRLKPPDHTEAKPAWIGEAPPYDAHSPKLGEKNFLGKPDNLGKLDSSVRWNYKTHVYAADRPFVLSSGGRRLAKEILTYIKFPEFGG